MHFVVTLTRLGITSIAGSGRGIGPRPLVLARLQTPTSPSAWLTPTSFVASVALFLLLVGMRESDMENAGCMNGTS